MHVGQQEAHHFTHQHSDIMLCSVAKIPVEEELREFWLICSWKLNKIMQKYELKICELYCDSGLPDILLDLRVGWHQINVQ